MSFKIYTEKEIRKAIIKKAKPEIPKSRASHDKGHIKIEGKIVLRIKIPNEHLKDFGPSKAKRLASQLKLSPDEYNNFFDCNLDSAGYFGILREKIS